MTHYTAAFLESGKVAAIASHFAALIAAACISSADFAGGTLLALAIVLWPASVYHALRVSIDAGLFANLGDPTALDEFLVRHKLANPPGARSLDDRIAGALTLWRRQLAITAIQVLAAVCGVLISRWAHA